MRALRLLDVVGPRKADAVPFPRIFFEGSRRGAVVFLAVGEDGSSSRRRRKKEQRSQRSPVPFCHFLGLQPPRCCISRRSRRGRMGRTRQRRIDCVGV